MEAKKRAETAAGAENRISTIAFFMQSQQALPSHQLSSFMSFISFRRLTTLMNLKLSISLSNLH